MKRTLYFLSLYIILTGTQGCYGQAVNPGKEPEWFRDKYGGFTIDIKPVNETVMEGKDIILEVSISCDTPRVIPFTIGQIINHLQLYSNGQLVQTNSAVNFEKEPKLETRIEFTHNIAPYFYNVDDQKEQDYRHLRSGSYYGFFEYGSRSNNFWFEVLPFPDSLRMVWEQFVHLNQCRVEWVGYIKQGVMSREEILDSMRVWSEYFLSLTPNHSWRSEAIRSVLYLWKSLRHSWQEGDSARVVSLLHGLGHEDHGFHGLYATSTIFKNLNSREKASALIRLGQEIGTEKAIRATQALAEHEIKEAARLDSIRSKTTRER